MAQVKYIKHLREKEDKSISEIANRVGINWRTAKKYADQEDWNQTRIRKLRKRPVIGAFEEIVMTWLYEDQRLPKKQRHTAQRIYDRLVSEYGYKGSDRTVRRFVAQAKKKLKFHGSSIKLSHPPGEVQADFGSFQAFCLGVLRELKFLVLSFPYSNVGFAQVLPSENLECFLEGLRRIFEYIGGVPTVIRFDNLSAAVIKVLKEGERELTETFERFCLHYRFKQQFCNPDCGNEKGSVENKVGFIRRNWFVPIVQIEDLNEYNLKLFELAEKDMERKHYEKDMTIKELFESEKECLLLLPKVSFEAVRFDTATVDNYGRIKLDSTVYEGIPAKGGEKVHIKAYWDRIEILNSQYEKIAQRERSYGLKETKVDWLTHFQSLRHKPRAVTYSIFFPLLPEPVREFLKCSDLTLRKQRVKFLIDLIKQGEMDEVAAALQRASISGLTDFAIIRHFFYDSIDPNNSPEPLEESYTPDCFTGYNPDLNEYDKLLRR